MTKTHKRPRYSDERQPGALAESDIALIYRIALAKQGDGPPVGVLLDVFGLAPSIRRRWSEIVTDVVTPDMPPATWHRRCAELHELCERAQRHPMLADGFIMPGPEWRAKYDPVQ